MHTSSRTGAPHVATPVGRTARWTFAATVALSAGLLFLVQPLVGRLVLPTLGGSAAVWTTCLLFFQATLLAGYAWAHVQTRVPPAWRKPAHVAVLASGGLLLPLAIRSIGDPPSQGLPSLWLLTVLAWSCGIPVVALASNTSTLQRWYAESTGRTPYGLYAVSNVASLVGLLSYPVAWEPFSSLSTQRYAWSILYVIEIAGVGACAIASRRLLTPMATTDVAAAPRPRSGDVVRWVGLAAMPASLVAGVTSYMTSDLAPMPLLWVIPLSLYLLTFVASFGGRPLRRASMVTRVFPVLAVPCIALEVSSGAPTWSLFALHLASFTLLAALSHGRLWATRPPADHLTAFYLWIAVGGAVGGLLNAIVAPVLFSGPTEYPLAIVLAVALLVVTEREASRADRLAAAAGVASGLAWLVFAPASNPTVAVSTVALFTALPSIRRPLLQAAVALVVAVLFLRVGRSEMRQPAHQARSFYASLRVIDDFRPGVRALVHGATIHGLQARDRERARAPLSYYTDAGPLGQAMTALGPLLDDAQIGVVGLGVGELAAKARKGQRWTFYEIDPLVARVAQDPRWFTYLANSAVRPVVILGDGRRSLQSSRERFSLLVVDAFSSDSIPIHLLTREAIALYLRRLEPDGMLAFHISNRFVNLEHILAALATDAGLDVRVRFDPADTPAAAATRLPSRWVIMARPGGIPGALGSESGWRLPADSRQHAVWTDERNDLVSAMWELR